MNFLSGLFPVLGELVKLIPNGDKRAELATKVQELETELAKGQLAVNAEEAKHANWFVAGWRPATGWVCVSGLLYNVLAPAFGLPTGSTEVLLTLLFGMLGLGGLRTFEKTRK
jgi:hypothetical protein